MAYFPVSHIEFSWHCAGSVALQQDNNMIDVNSTQKWFTRAMHSYQRKSAKKDIDGPSHTTLRWN
jgi:hypothetical protein